MPRYVVLDFSIEPSERPVTISHGLSTSLHMLTSIPYILELYNSTPILFPCARNMIGIRTKPPLLLYGDLSLMAIHLKGEGDHRSVPERKARVGHIVVH